MKISKLGPVMLCRLRFWSSTYTYIVKAHDQHCDNDSSDFLVKKRLMFAMQLWASIAGSFLDFYTWCRYSR